MYHCGRATGTEPRRKPNLQHRRMWHLFSAKDRFYFLLFNFGVFAASNGTELDWKSPSHSSDPWLVHLDSLPLLLFYSHKLKSPCRDIEFQPPSLLIALPLSQSALAVLNHLLHCTKNLVSFISKLWTDLWWKVMHLPISPRSPRCPANAP